MATNTDGYWSRSKALLMAPQGWFKPLLVMAAANMVPIVGPFGVDGYTLEYGRLTAWGVDGSPKQRDVNVGACIASGARAFVVALGYLIVLNIVSRLVGAVFGDGLGGLLGLVLSVVGGIIILVAKLRATIYQNISGGYQVDRIIDMIKRDTNGLLRVMGLSLAMGAILGVIVSVLITGIMIGHIGDIVHLAYQLDSGYVDDVVVVRAVLKIVGSMLPLLFVLGYVVSVLFMFTKLIETTAVALWMRQFDVQHWGDSSDPLPESGPAYPAGGAAAPQQAAPTQEPAQPWSTQPAPQAQEPAQPWSVQPAPQAQEPAQTWMPIPTPVDSEARMSGGPAATPAPAAGPAPADSEVPTFDLSGYGSDAVSAPEAAPAAPAAPAPQADEPARFTLDTMTEEEPVDHIPFTFDDLIPAAPAEPAAPHVPFTLDDASSAAPAESAAPHVPFTLDGDSPESEVVDADHVPFTLEDAAGEPNRFALEPEPEVVDEPAPEPFYGKVENDDDARRALTSLDMSVQPFNYVVGTPVTAEVEAVDDVAEAEAAEEPQVEAVVESVVDESEDVEEVPTFSLDDFDEEPEPAAAVPTSGKNDQVVEAIDLTGGRFYDEDDEDTNK